MYLLFPNYIRLWCSFGKHGTIEKEKILLVSILKLVVSTCFPMEFTSCWRHIDPLVTSAGNYCGMLDLLIAEFIWENSLICQPRLVKPVSIEAIVANLMKIVRVVSLYFPV